MRYTVQSGTGGYGGLRVVLETPEAALDAAQDMTGRGAKDVRIVDDKGNSSEVADFSRKMCGHQLTQEQLALVKSTSDVLMMNDRVAADLFYAKLFEIAPQVRSLFADDLANQKTKLLETLVLLVEQATMRQSSFADIVKGLGRRHVAYGARPDHYEPVGQALLHSLDSLLGTRFTPDVKNAWTALYLDVAAAMAAAPFDGLASAPAVPTAEDKT